MRRSRPAEQSGRSGVIAELERWRRLAVGYCGRERSPGLGDAGESAGTGGVIELPGSWALGEAMDTAGMEGGSLLHGTECAEGV